MSGETDNYELPKAVDKLLAALSKLHAQEGNRRLQEIIVNAQTRIHEAWSADNWNGGTYGHALYLTIPESLFLASVNDKADLQTEIKNNLNKIHNVQNEFIEEVFIEMEADDGGEWREDSGLLLMGKRVVSPDAVNRVWPGGGFRVFLSHKSEAKREAAALKDRLTDFGISGFVAHEDILPTKEWQDEIEHALETMDAFVALMTEKFHESDWTDQEVGFAFARGVPIIAVRLGKDPYGFIGKFQGLSADWPTAPDEIVKILLKNERMFSAYIAALRKCPNWEAGNGLSKALPGIKTATSHQIDELVSAYNETRKLQGSWGFNGANARFHGPGLVSHLNRLGTREFRFGSDGRVEALV